MYKLLNEIEITDEIRVLVKMVRAERKDHKTCLSAQDNIDMKSLLKEIAETEAYKDDYENITLPLLFIPVEYEEAISAINKIIEENVF